MSNTTQKEAVFNAVSEVFGTDFSNGVSLTSAQKQEVIGMVMSGLKSGSVAFSEEAKAKYLSDDKELKKYTTGLVDNWLRKDTRFTGGVKYQPKNPGSRAGQGDEVLKNLRLLRKTLTDADAISAVDTEISARMVAIQAAKAPKIEVNADAIPESLRHLIAK